MTSFFECFWASTLKPLISIVPSSAGSRKLMVRRNVVLPEPEGPRMTTTSPFLTLMSTPLSTWFEPNDFWMPLSSSM